MLLSYSQSIGKQTYLWDNGGVSHSTEIRASEKQVSKSTEDDIAVIFEKGNPNNLKMVTYAKPSSVKAVVAGKNQNKNLYPKGLSEKGFQLLASYEATNAVKDKKGNVVSIPILDIGDGKYTIGIGNTVKKTDNKAIQEYKKKYGIDVTKVGSQVDIKTCMKIYNDHVNQYTSAVNSLLQRYNHTVSQNEYDALVIAVYNRPALASKGHALDTLIKKNNHNKKDWRTTITNEYKGLAKWNQFGKGWCNRIEDELELYFDKDYLRNH